MSKKVEGHDPIGTLTHFIQLMDKKCQELPHDIAHWQKIASGHDIKSQAYHNVVGSSVKPREEYLAELRLVKEKCLDIKAMATPPDAIAPVIYSVDMPIETLLRRFGETKDVLKKYTDKNHALDPLFHSAIEDGPHSSGFESAVIAVFHWRY